MLFSRRKFISFLIYHDGVWNEINLYATVVSCLSRFTLVQLSCVREARSAFNIVDRVIYNGTVCHKVYGRVQITTRDLFFFFTFSRPIALSFWARKSDVSGADKLRSDWKVSATWVESRLGEIPICVCDEEGGREREKKAKDGWLEDFFPSYRNMGHSIFSRSPRSRVSGLLRFANTRVFLSMRFSRCNLIRLQAYASTSRLTLRD